jgi:hypothetical protein
MPATESALPADWFAQGDLDIRAAEILLTQDGPLPVIAFHLQQAVEKYLKGFLPSTGLVLAPHPRPGGPDPRGYRSRSRVRSFPGAVPTDHAVRLWIRPGR